MYAQTLSGFARAVSGLVSVGDIPVCRGVGSNTCCVHGTCHVQLVTFGDPHRCLAGSAGVCHAIRDMCTELGGQGYRIELIIGFGTCAAAA